MPRRGTAGDAGAAADLYLRARSAAAQAGTIPPCVHADEEVRGWFASVVVPDRELWLADAGGAAPAAILVLDGDWLDGLYVEPGLTGHGIGAALLGHAKRERPGGLQLWAFESNAPARRFYERHGFSEAERTDGSGNEERAPDVRYVWPGAAG